MTLRFVGESHEDTDALRDGSVDLELGQMRRTHPETHIEPLFSDRMVGVVRAGHELATKRVTLQRFADAEHVVSSRRGPAHAGRSTICSPSTGSDDGWRCARRARSAHCN